MVVTPSDTAPAVVALDAAVIILGCDEERVVRVEDFFMTPSLDITRMTVVEPTEVLTTIRIPDTWAGVRFYFEKVADRNTWDSALVSVAAALAVRDGMIDDLRVACSACRAD